MSPLDISSKHYTTVRYSNWPSADQVSQLGAHMSPDAESLAQVTYLILLEKLLIGKAPFGP